MIVDDLYVFGSIVRPPKYDPPLIVYPDRMPAGETASQGFQAVSRRGSKIAQQGSVVQLYQFAASDLGNVSREPLRNASLFENQLGERTAITPDHYSHMYHCVIQSATIRDQ